MMTNDQQPADSNCTDTDVFVLTGLRGSFNGFCDSGGILLFERETELDERRLWYPTKLKVSGLAKRNLSHAFLSLCLALGFNDYAYCSPLYRL